MAVIPSGTSEPWGIIARENAANDALSRLFVQENMRREMQQQQFGENAVNRDWRAGQQDKQLSWQGDKLNQQQQFASEQNQLSRENAMNMTQYRTDAATARAGAGGKAGKHQIIFGDDVIQAWDAIEQKYKLPQGYLSTIVGVESAGGANMHRPGAQYHGPFQFGNEAAKAMGITMAQRYDPIASGEAAARFAATNRETATKLSNGAIRWTGGPQDIAKLYMLHQQGVGGGMGLLLPANQTRQAYQVGIPANLMSNNITSNMSAQQAVEMYEKKLIPWYNSYGQRKTNMGGGAPAQAAQSAQTAAPTVQQPPMQQPPVQPTPTASGPAVQTQSMPATNPSVPATHQQPQQQQSQPQPGGGSVPPSTVSPQVFAQPPNAVAGASGAGAPQPLTQGASVTAPATAPQQDITQMPQAGGAFAMPSSQTTNVTGAPAGAMGDRATPSVAPAPPPGTRKRVTKYIDEDGVLRFSNPE